MEKPLIKNFVFEAYCGSGVYGDVWVGRKKDGSKCAIKVLNTIRLKSLNILYREEKAIHLFRSQVPRHPNLIEIFHAGTTDSLLYYVMELADNFVKDSNETDKYIPDTLANRLEFNGNMQVQECSNIILSLLDALEILHNVNLVHRDIKPSNIILPLHQNSWVLLQLNSFKSF